MVYRRVMPNIRAVAVLGSLALMLTVGAHAQGPAVIALDGTPLHLTADTEGEGAASFYVTAAVEVLEEEGDLARVRTLAWAELNEEGQPESPLFTNDSDLIRVADAPDPSVFETVERHEGWVELEVEGWVASEALADDTEALYEEAADIYQRFCTGCHAGYARPVEQIRSQIPPETLPDTARRMAMGTGIADDQLNLIIHWLQDKPE